MKDLVGTIFLSRFRVDTLLSAGASGSLYKGWDMKRNLPLSIKIFETPVPYDPNALCFQQDDGTLQTLMHPNIAPFYGLFEDQGLSFLVEKYIEGQVLAQQLQQRNGQPFPTQEALIYLKTLATTLEYAHGFGLVHCTVNPFNILTGRDGTVILTNFGFSRHADRSMSSSGILGLPAYNAPEQLRSANVSPATDVYALGMLFFELIVGVHPFLRIPTSNAVADRVTIDRLREAHLNQAPPDPCQLNSTLPDGISQTISIALAKDPKQRYQSVQEMLEIICAVFGVPVQQVPERLRPSGRAPQPPLRTCPWARCESMPRAAPLLALLEAAAARYMCLPPRPAPAAAARAPNTCLLRRAAATSTLLPRRVRAPNISRLRRAAAPAPNTSSQHLAQRRPITNHPPALTRQPVKARWERRSVSGSPGVPGQAWQGTMPVSAAPPPAVPPLRSLPGLSGRKTEAPGLVLDCHWRLGAHRRLVRGRPGRRFAGLERPARHANPRPPPLPLSPPRPSRLPRQPYRLSLSPPPPCRK